MSDYFYVSDGVRQGGILSPKLYSVYVDDLSDYLVKRQIGCHIDNVCVNHVMYADDICLMAPSPAALQKLINICYDFSIQNNLSFISTKSFCMVFKPRLYNLLCPTFYMNTEILDYAAKIKYLAFTFSSDKKDDNDMLRQMRVFYTKDYYVCFNVVQLMSNLICFVVTVLAFIVLFYGLIIRSQLIASLELLLTMSIVAY